MKISTIIAGLLLVCHYVSVYSYDRHYRHMRANDIDCTNQAHCSENKGMPSQPETQKLIDCDNLNNCQTNTLKSKRQQSNDCRNQIDCQEDTGYPRRSSHQRRSHRHRSSNHISRQSNGELSQQLISMTALQDWNCNFGTNDCGIHNQYNMGSYFLPMPDSSDPVLGKKGLLYLDLARAKSGGARLITPYFPTNGCRYACLTIEYILCGQNIENLYLIQQDVRNYCVMQKRNDHSYRWTAINMTVDLTRGSPRFFLEVRFNPNNKYGFVGISDMKFKYGECDHNEANECDLNEFVGTLL